MALGARRPLSAFRSKWIGLVGAVLLGLSAAQPAFARFQPEPCKNAYSVEQEIAEGRKAAAQVSQQMPVLPDSNPVSQYVQGLGMKLAQYAPGYKWPYSFHVADVADINAFALPGGTIFINLGTIQAAETEAQLAGVMAHEMSHVVQRHSTCNATKQRGASVAAGLGQIAAQVLLGGNLGSLAAQGIGFGTGLTFLKMSRGSEKQADLMGTDILYDAGYDPRAMPQFFETIEGKYGQGGSQFLSDHPNPGNRIEYVQGEIDSLPPKAHYIKTSAEFTRVKGTVAGMHAYTAKEVASGVWKRQSPNGTVASGVNAPSQPVTATEWTPSGNWQLLSQAGYTVSYPGNWKTYNGPGSATTVAPVGGVAQGNGGNGAVIYGVLIDSLSGGGQVDLASGTHQLIAQLESNNPQLKAGAVSDVIVNRVPGKSVECTNADPGEGGRAEHDWVVTLEQPDGILRYLVFVAPEADFNKLRPTFEQMLRSFKFAA